MSAAQFHLLSVRLLILILQLTTPILAVGLLSGLRDILKLALCLLTLSTLLLILIYA